MDDLIELIIFMVAIAVLAFAPLGYFIYIYTKKNGEPFGDIEPHGDSKSPLLNLIERTINSVKSALKIK